jgi:hypothetical protein
MAKQPVVSGAEAVRAFQRAGWHVDRQRGRVMSCSSNPVISPASQCRSILSLRPERCEP